MIFLVDKTVTASVAKRFVSKPSQAEELDMLVGIRSVPSGITNRVWLEMRELILWCVDI